MLRKFRFEFRWGVMLQGIYKSPDRLYSFRVPQSYRLVDAKLYAGGQIIVKGIHSQRINYLMRVSLRQRPNIPDR